MGDVAVCWSSVLVCKLDDVCDFVVANWEEVVMYVLF